ncbi:MAG: hypothetical protein R2699_08605 [Acidimicrobiales bacterium]
MGLLLTACNEQEAPLTKLTRDANAAVGLPMFQDNGPLSQKAMAWAQQMAANGGISHSDLAAGNPTTGSCWARTSAWAAASASMPSTTP